MGVITDDDIRRAVSRNAFHAGAAYQLAGRVQGITYSPDGSIIEAKVRGSTPTPYRQTIELAQRQGQFEIDGECTCPVGFNCKHVAAALLAYRQQSGASVRPAKPAAAVARKPPELALPRPQAEAPLPTEIDIWLRSLHAAQEIETEDYPANVRKRLLYVLYQDPYSGGVAIDLRSIELRRDGLPNGLTTQHSADNLLRSGQQPKFLRPSDRDILRGLGSVGTGDEAAAAAKLTAIIATGRGRWAKWDGPVLVQGAPIKAPLVWALADDGSQRPAFDLPQGLRALGGSVAWYVDPEAGVMGPIETDLPAKLVRAMLASPALHPASVERVRAEMGRRWPQHSLPEPRSVAPPEQLHAPLQPRLQLLAGDHRLHAVMMAMQGRYPPPAATTPLPLARLSWRYGPVTLQLGDARADPVVHRAGRLLQVKRDPRAEAQATERLHRLGFGRLTLYQFQPGQDLTVGDMVLQDPDPVAWIDFMVDDLPRLRAEGWLIEIADDFPLRLADPAGDVSFEIHESSGIDWFDLDLGVMVDGVRINLVPALLDLIAGSSIAEPGPTDGWPTHLLIPLPDGRLLPVPMAKLHPILAPLLELFGGIEPGAATDAIRLSRHSAGDLALLEAASAATGIAWAGGDAIRALGRQLREHGGIPPCAIPAGFAATLRPYQQHGLAWLQLLAAAGLGGILADDMGLGKTVQALAHLAVEQEAGRADRPSLVVCPTSLVANWRAEAARFAPTLRCLVLHGPDRAARFADIARHDLVITTYPLLSRDQAALVAQDWHVVMLDEAQTIKNPLANTSKLARTLRARQRLCLSGTPLENHLGELWSLFDFFAPGFLGDRQSFGRRFRTPIEKAGNTQRQTALARRVAPFLLRRTKAEVAADLPPKTEIAEPVDMADAQRAVYESIRLAMHAKVRAAIAKRGLAGSGIIILDALLKLRQACCDPRLLKLTTAKAAKAGSAKLERLLEMLPQLLEEGRRVLLFSQFTSMLALIQDELARLDLPYVLLTGDTRDRATPVRRFQTGEVKLFLISLKAGGVGLNLTAADTVIHYDPWWNPAVEDQATDRAHRIGQDKPVFVHRLITTGTIEEKMEILKQRKQALAAGILGAAAGAALTLNEGDLDMLFGGPG